MFSYRDEKEILNVSYDLDDLEKVLEQDVNVRRIGDMASKLHKLINEHTFSSAWAKIEMLGTPYVNTNTLNVVDMVSEKYHPDLLVMQEQFVSIAPIYGMQGALTFFDFGCDNSSRMQLPGPVAGAIEQRFKITKFAESAGMYAKGKFIKRQTAIDFVRNKRGGAHAIDWNIGHKDQRKLHDILAAIYDPRPFKHGRYQGLVQIKDNNMNQVEMYIWNIATDLVYSEDTQLFLEQVRKTFPVNAP